jgi:hypothetical protein
VEGLQVHEPVLLQVLVQVEGVGQLSSAQTVASVQVMWQPFPVQVVLQLPTFRQVMLQPPPAHVNWQLPVSPQVKAQPPPGQSYWQLPTTLHEQLAPAAHVPLKLPTLVELPQLEAATQNPTRHASSNPSDLPNVMTSSGAWPRVELSIDMRDLESGKSRPERAGGRPEGPACVVPGGGHRKALVFGVAWGRSAAAGRP